MNGIFTIKWKKGVEMLNINQDDNENEEVKTHTREEKQKGFGKFQTYANLLKGEEKE